MMAFSWRSPSASRNLQTQPHGLYWGVVMLAFWVRSLPISRQNGIHETGFSIETKKRGPKHQVTRTEGAAGCAQTFQITPHVPHPSPPRVRPPALPARCSSRWVYSVSWRIYMGSHQYNESETIYIKHPLLSAVTRGRYGGEY